MNKRIKKKKDKQNFNKRNQMRNQLTKNLTTYESDGFTFVFDDEELQKEYVTTWNHFNDLLSGKANLPLPDKVQYQDATSLTRGRNFKALSRFENIYEQNDNSWQQKGGLHKNWLFNEALKDSDGSQDISTYIKNVNHYLDRLADESGVSSNSLKGSNRLRYHKVFYGNQQSG